MLNIVRNLPRLAARLHRFAGRPGMAIVSTDKGAKGSRHRGTSDWIVARREEFRQPLAGAPKNAQRGTGRLA